MPALFAYLIGVGLLLGGGYGALTWLAAPEPVEVAAKAKPAAHSGARSGPNAAAESRAETSAVVASSPAINDHDKVAAGSNDQTPAPAAKARLAASQPDVQGPPESGLDQPARSAHADALAATSEPHVPDAAVEAGSGDKQPAQVALQGRPADLRSASAAAAKAAARPRLRPARHHETDAPVLMTLRTIEYPDGRRVTRLIPYSGERALAFQPDE